LLTESTTAVSAVVKEADGTVINDMSVVKGTPAVIDFQKFTNNIGSEYVVNSVISCRIEHYRDRSSFIINIRNASDAFSGDSNYIKGMLLTSFGDGGVGVGELGIIEILI
jgi:hypothetical protein